jgi:ABC-type bacteriocin/lantibiotic exporter with double-glycine peptidase domain
MRGVATLRVSGHQDGGASRWIPFLVRKLESRFRQEQLAVLEYTAIDGLRVIILAMLISSGAGRVLDGGMSIGAFVAYYGIAGTMLGALAATASKLVPAAHVAVHLRRIRDVFEAEPEQDRAAARAPGKLRGRVAFEDVSFTYDGASAPVLDRVSLEIEPGMKVAIVGASGAGKTTLGRLLLGFYKPASGRVLYDGKDLWGLDLTAVRRQLGVVLQDTYLFSGSVRQNVALGAPDSTVDQVWEAVRLAGIEPEVRAMPMQLETFVAEAGGAFSGGQRQRLAIARALIRRPPIVLLDEATSALDNLSQGIVEDGLAGLACTRIVIAHRLSTVIDADRIVVLDAGHIVEQGTHAELLLLGGHYARLMGPQMMEAV